MKTSIFRNALLLLCIFVVSANAMQDQTFLLDPGINLVSTDITAAQDPVSRNILVIFNELNINNPSYGRIHAVLLKYAGNGKYKRKKLRTLSPAGSWAGRPHVAYLTGMKRFIVVWDTADPTTFGAPSRIVGQIIKAKNGKAIGDNFNIANDGGLNVSPVIVRLPDSILSASSSPSTATLKNTRGVLFWNRYDTNDYSGENLGLVYRPATFKNKNTVNFSIDYEKVFKDLRVDGGLQLSSIPVDAWPINADPGNNRAPYLLGLSFEYQYRDGSQNRTRGESFMVSGVYNPQNGLNLIEEANYTFGDGTSAQFGPGIATLSDNPMFCEMGAISLDLDMQHFNFFRFRGGAGDSQMNLEDILNVDFGDGQLRAATSITNYNFSEAPEINAFIGSFAPSANETRGHIIAAFSDGWVYQQRIKDQTAFKKKPVKMFQHNDKLQSMNAYRIDLLGDPGGWNNVLVLWQRKISNTRHEARAYIGKLK